jgi:hypothetical protein
MPVLTSYDGSKDDIANMGTAGKAAQSFKIPATALVDSIDFYGGKGTVGTQPGTFKFEIVQGGFNGTVIATTATVSSSGYANWDVAPAWHNLALTVPVTLTAGVEYFLRFTAVSGSTNDCMRWVWDNTSPTYADGNIHAEPGPTSYPTLDANFRINGNVLGGATSQKSSPLLMMGVG